MHCKHSNMILSSIEVNVTVFRGLVEKIRLLIVILSAEQQDS